MSKSHDYHEFLKGKPRTPPRELSDRVLGLVKSDLEPGPWIIFSKLAGIHLGVGLVTVSACPQFGVHLFGEGVGLMSYFSHLGTHGCMAACGAFFIGMSLLVAAFILSRAELLRLKAHPVLQLAALTLLSLGAFIMADAEILLIYAAIWVVGSFVGGLLALELGAYLRFKWSSA